MRCARGRQYGAERIRSDRRHRPHDGRRIDASAPGTTTVIRQIDYCVKVTRLHRRLHERALDPIEHELGPPEHLELVVWKDVAPREVDESIADLALHCGSTEVEEPILPNDIDVGLPDRLGHVRSDQLRSVAPDLDADVDVVHGGTVRTTEHEARQVDAGDHTPHPTMMPAARRLCSVPAIRDTSPRRRSSPSALRSQGSRGSSELAARVATGQATGARRQRSTAPRHELMVHLGHVVDRLAGRHVLRGWWLEATKAAVVVGIFHHKVVPILRRALILGSRRKGAQVERPGSRAYCAVHFGELGLGIVVT